MMDPSTIINALFLCLVNASFMVAGIFLNAVVIISLRRSSQFRKKPCYFMILVLSCFDLAVVAINHPLLILSAIFCSYSDCSKPGEQVRGHIYNALYAFSMAALVTLNIERFLGLTFPIFHRTSVTKGRLLILQAFLTILLFGEIALSRIYLETALERHIFIIAELSALLFLFIYFNYKMFIIAMSKFGNDEVVATTATSRDGRRKKHTLNMKIISSCSLAVACFFICSSPHITYSALRLTSETPFYDNQVVLFHLWADTFVAMNSTFNCLIFFWKILAMRREGMKIVKRLWTARA